uniref:Uncharacterized protein n=1 Tax=Brugia malayi TaxID=6279 RepID=A8NEU1_BRUMA
MNRGEFLSNDENFCANLPQQDRAIRKNMKILGIPWNPYQDVIQVTLRPWSEQELTKRTILQFVALQYDTLGFLAPIMRSILISSVPSESGIARKKSSLIFAKSRIAPIKGMTIPHLELMAVLIGSRAAQFVMTQLDFTSGTKKFLFRGMYRLPDILFDFKFGLNQQSDAQ